MKTVYIKDTTLRDGSHAISHQFMPKDISEIALSLEDAGADIISVGHGDGLGGSSLQYGLGAITDLQYVNAAASVLNKAKLQVLLLPGIGTINDLKLAKKHGANVAGISTHITEADIAEQHIKVARDMGMFTIGYLIMCHMESTEKLTEQALLMESYGAEVIYITDSAGAFLPHEVKQRVCALKNNLSIPVGFHAHNNLGLAIANSLVAIKEGATYIDSSLMGFGAGAGNCSTEMLLAVLKKMEIPTNMDLYKTIDAGNQVLLPLLKEKGVSLPRFTSDTLMLGYAGVYSSFLIHVKKAAEQFDVDSRDVLVELGNRKAVGGQEDWIIQVAHEISLNSLS
ncbi:MAG: 4-hydroxy-2-oxovalerate aldolase [Desulfitibacter sp. BRH_c19]|nr:MAG: 4-hydroxy-2-oxovalerate aldolase [Desulfitibacter sp. BRH_c19]